MTVETDGSTARVSTPPQSLGPLGPLVTARGVWMHGEDGARVYGRNDEAQVIA
jgi:hypothetical protein